MLSIRHAAVLSLLAALLAPLPAAAQGFGFTLGLLGGVGGSPDSEEYSGGSFQALASLDVARRTHTQLRLGRLDIDLENSGIVLESELSYVTIGSEYRYDADFYTSGVILGIGWYDLDDDFGLFADDALGAYAGVTGDFALSDRWSLLVELSGHWADLDGAQVFLMGNAGIAFHF